MKWLLVVVAVVAVYVWAWALARVASIEEDLW